MMNQHVDLLQHYTKGCTGMLLSCISRLSTTSTARNNKKAMLSQGDCVLPK